MEKDRRIRFIDQRYNDLFYLNDGEKIIITRYNGEKALCACRYLDDYHVQVGSRCYHIQEFAEAMALSGSRYEPEKPPELPEYCYAVLPETGEVACLRRGERECRRYPQKSSGGISASRRYADEQNRLLRVTPQQAAAMLGGFMHGWDSPAARTSSYDVQGRKIPVRPKHQRNGQQR